MSALANTDLINTKSSWPADSAWIEIPKLRDGSDITATGWDFTWNTSSQGTVYYYDDGSFLYFRTRLKGNTVTWNSSSPGAIWIYIKKAGSANLVDFAIAWDAANFSNKATHGLEMQTLDSASSSLWPSLTMKDVDALPNAKTIADINYTGYTDGYLRVVDGLTRADEGTCYLDWAVSWAYLNNTTRHSNFGLSRSDTWYVAVGSLCNSNDHGPLGDYVNPGNSSDVAGLVNYNSTAITEGGLGWSGTISPQGKTSRTWDGTSTASSNWRLADSGNPGANWTPDALPAKNDNLIFPDNADRKSNVNNLLATVGSVTFSAGSSGGYSLSLDNSVPSFTIYGGILNQITANTTTWGIPTTLGADQTFSVAYGGTLDFNGAIVNGGYLLTVDSVGATLFDGAVSGTGGLTKSGGGTLTLTAENTYGGPTTVSAGKLVLNGSLASASPISVDSGATLAGIGTAGNNPNATDTLTINGTVAPGNSVGTLNINGAVRWNAGGVYEWEINDANSTAGTGWDWMNINGALKINATTESRYTIKIISLAGAASGPAADFDCRTACAWHIATVSGAINGFDASKFTIDSSQFQNFTGGGTFSVALSSDTKSVDVVFTPHVCAAGDFNPVPSWNTDGGTINITIQNNYGLATVMGLRFVNCTMAGTAYGAENVVLQTYSPMTQDTPYLLPIGTIKVVVVGTRVNSNLRASCNARASDLCRTFSATIDPVSTLLEIGGSGETLQTFTDIPSAERYISVQNGASGLRKLSILVNGHPYVLESLGDGESKTLDVSAAMNPGEGNTVVLVGEGAEGSSAMITIGDAPAGEPLTNSESIALRTERSDSGLRLSWAAAGSGYVLQSRSGLESLDAWVDWPEPPVWVDGRFVVTVPLGSTAEFFRLHKP